MIHPDVVVRVCRLAVRPKGGMMIDIPLGDPADTRAT